MAKSQKRSNREIRKPKANATAAPAAPIDQRPDSDVRKLMQKQTKGKH